jgi:hypothetical protein
MHYLLCRNRVRRSQTWRAIFDSHAPAHREDGLTLVNLWQAIDDDADIYFLYAVSGMEKAKSFVSKADNTAIARATGVLEGEMRYLGCRPDMFLAAQWNLPTTSSADRRVPQILGSLRFCSTMNMM